MIFFWKPPGAAIVLGNIAVVVFGVGYLLTQVYAVLPPGNQSFGRLIAVCGITTVLSDMVFRRMRRLALFNLSASTWFFILPSWTVGLGIVGYGGYLMVTP